MKKSLWGGVLLAGVLMAPLGRATTLFTTNPVNGVLQGQPGSVVGWGFSLFNDTNYIVVTLTTFTQLTGPGIGTYSDIISSEFFPVGPATTETWAQTFDPNASTGLASFTINPAVPIGTVITGTITVTFDVFLDPAATQQIGGDQTFAPLSFEIDVVPEPGTLFGTSAALLLVGILYVRRRGKSAGRASA